MKKIFTLSMLFAAMIMPLTSAAHVSKSEAMSKGQICRVGAKSQAPAIKALPLKATKAVAPKADVPEGMASVTLAAGDIWGDGSGYQLLLDADATAYGSIIPETGGLTSAGDADPEVYAAFEYKIPENADGSCTTSNIIMNGEATILIPAGIYDYCFTNPTPGDRVWIASSNGDVPGRGDDFEFKSGAAYVFTITVVGSNDGVLLDVDDPNGPKLPENVTVTPDEDSALVAWDAVNNETAWNIRYRKLVPDDKKAYFNDFEEGNFDGIMIYDADGDGNNWSYASGEQQVTHSGIACLTSASYNGGALTPDNWLFFSGVTLGGTFSFWAAGQDPNWAQENFSAYVYAGEELEDISDMIPLQENITATATMTQYSFDLSAYSGPGIVAIRHHNCTDWFRLNIDDVLVDFEGSEIQPGWTNIEAIDTKPFTISGLLPNTEYELQVQSIKEGAMSAWTESVIFSTKESGVEGIAADKKADNVWYNIMGVRLNGQPTSAGIYINNGKKVVVR